MNLSFNRHGVKLFFLTFAVEGRRKLLSTVTDETTRPTLTDLGAAVKALWRSVHKVYPWLGTSDYVIMPDHVHLLLVVDFDRCPGFNPLVFTHWFKDQSAIWINAIIGGSAPAPLADTRELAPLPDFIFCPCGFAYPETPPCVAAAPSGAAAPCGTAAPSGAAPNSAAASGGAAAPGGAGAEPPIFAWERAFWLDLPMSPRHLKAIRHYIRLNPARQLWKTRHPDLFRCCRALKAARLARFGSQRFDGLGNLTLLGSPFLFHVRLTLKKSLAEHAEAIEQIVERAKRGEVPVSGFISPGEKEALRRLKAEPSARFIKLLPFTLPDRYDPSAEDSREIAAGRLAILSGFTDTPAIASRDMRLSPAAAHAFRANCLAMNDLAAKLCEV